MLIFISTRLTDTYKTIYTWMETYENGELISSSGRMNSQIYIKEGKIAIMVDKASNYKWRISHQGAGALSSCSFETKKVLDGGHPIPLKEKSADVDFFFCLNKNMYWMSRKIVKIST